MPRLYERIRRELGPDAVIVRTRSLLRENAEPLIEVLASAPEAQPEVSLDLQWQMIDGALGRLQISRPRATVGDLEDMVAREGPAALASPAVAASRQADGPRWDDGYVNSMPPKAETTLAGEDSGAIVPALDLDRPDLPHAVDGPAPFQPRPRPGIVQKEQRPGVHRAGEEAQRPAARHDKGFGTMAGVADQLVTRGFARSAAEVIERNAPGESNPAVALARLFEQRNVRYPDEHRTALITMRGMIGSGRTTALVRMALDCADAGRNAVLLSGDSSHVGAREQIHAYAEAIGIEAVDALDSQEMVRQVSRLKRGTCVFADVPAGDWRAPALAAVEQLAYLVVPAHWQAPVLEKATVSLPTASFAGCILSFSDLATDLVPALSLVIDSQLGLAFLSSGRDVSTGIEIADPLTLASGIFAARTGERADGRLVASA